MDRRIPRFYTVLVRAQQYARTNNLQLFWTVARDIPLHRDDRDLLPAQLDDKRKKWLQMHDQDTAHIASEVPLAHGLPIRLTDAVDRKRGLSCWAIGDVKGLNLAWAVWHHAGSKIEVKADDGTVLKYKLIAIVEDKIPDNQKVSKIWKTLAHHVEYVNEVEEVVELSLIHI